MHSSVHDLLYRLAENAPLPVPVGETGVSWHDETGGNRSCVPILSMYLDWRPEISGGRPAERAATVLVEERLRQIEKTLLPRGMALDSLRADGLRVRRYLATVAPASQGVAIFASSAHHLFETLQVSVPFETQISVGAQPDLFQLARLVSPHETAVVAVVDTHSARLFVALRRGLQDVDDLSEDPKLYHMVHGENAMNQAHYQRHAGAVRARFAHEVADHIARLVEQYDAAEVFLAGHMAGIALVRKALAPRIAQMVHEPVLALDVTTNPTAISDKIAPFLRALRIDRERSTGERFLEALRRGNGLATVGLNPTMNALQAGQVESLILAEADALPAEARSELIRLATLTDAVVEIVGESEALAALGGVGALLRYRVAVLNSYMG